MVVYKSMSVLMSDFIKKSSFIAIIASIIVPLSASAGTVFDSLEKNQARNVQVSMRARVGPAEIAKGSFDINLTKTGYSVSTNYHTSGLASALTKSVGSAASRGVVSAGSLRPLSYANIQTSGRGRKVIMSYNGGVPSVNVTPKYSDMGSPAASAAQKAGTVDPVTGLMELALITGRDRNSPCGGTVRVFDGKRRYDISTQYVRNENVSTPAYKGTAAYCRGTYTQIAGFKSKDGVKSVALELWLADINNAGVSIPVRMRGTRGAIVATLYADHISIK